MRSSRARRRRRSSGGALHNRSRRRRSRDRRRRRRSSGRRAVQGRSRDDVGGRSLGCVAVDVDVETWVCVGVAAWEGDELGRCGLERTSACDGDLGAFRVELRGHGVKGDGLESDEVVTIGDGGGDSRSPRAVLCDHLTCGPRAAVDTPAKKTSLLNLEPLQSVGVDTSARSTTARCEVCQDGAGVVGPDLVPVGNDFRPSSDSSGELEST